MAAKAKLPLIFHCREAADDLIAIIKNNKNQLPSAVVHCFSQNKEFLKECLDCGIYVSFTANITYKKSQGLRDLVKYTPLESILLETDAPFLAAEPVRGKRNQPEFLKFLADEIARIKEMDFDQVARITTANAKMFFKI
ncbi:MAG: TatD family hydrolase [Candidatus Omnitrophota bacterium]